MAGVDTTAEYCAFVIPVRALLCVHVNPMASHHITNECNTFYCICQLRCLDCQWRYRSVRFLKRFVVYVYFIYSLTSIVKYNNVSLTKVWCDSFHKRTHSTPFWSHLTTASSVKGRGTPLSEFLSDGAFFFFLRAKGQNIPQAI